MDTNEHHRQAMIKAGLNFLGNEDASSRMIGAEYLGRWGAAFEVQASLIKTLHDEDEGVRIEAVKALGKIGDRQALPALEELRQNLGFFVDYRKRAEEVIYAAIQNIREGNNGNKNEWRN